MLAWGRRGRLLPLRIGAEELDPGPRVLRGTGHRPPLPAAFRPVLEFVTVGGGRLCVFVVDVRRARARGLSPVLAFGYLLLDGGEDGPPGRAGSVTSEVFNERGVEDREA